jgi:signal transduction histidine kinase
MRRHHALLRGRLSAFDVALAVVALVAGQVEASVNPPDGYAGGSVVAAHALGVVLSVPLVLRSRAPEVMLWAMSIGALVISLGWAHPLYFWSHFLPVSVAVYSAARLVDGWFGRWSWLVAAAAIDATVLHTPSARELSNVVFSAVVLGGCALAGRLVRRGADTRSHLAETLQQLAEEHRHAEQTAIREERHRIVREVQDVVAQAVGSMLVQVGAARLALEQAGEGVPGQLLAAEETGRRALAELRRSAGPSFDTEEPSRYEPLPDLTRLPELVRGFGDAGLHVEVETGDLGRLPPDLQISVYRMVQESLTNALRHAGPVRAHVRLQRTGDLLEVQISNEPGTPNRRLPSGGHGLRGLQQRASMFDGSLEAGPRGGFFVVRALLRVPSGDMSSASDLRQTVL